MKYVAFDLEITKEIPPGTDDWKSLRPLGISCAATLDSDGNLRLWHGELIDGKYPPSMNRKDCSDLIDYLLKMQSSGYPVVTWNGLGFDFDVLREESGHDAVKSLAKEHVDIAFAMFCEKGFMVGLDTAARGMGLAGKTEGMHGAMAPVLWAKGKQKEVLEYVAQDVRVTANLYEAITDKKRLRWISRSGKINFWYLHRKEILDVFRATEQPAPDVSWMTNPWPRSKFSGWLK